ncbi:hypothetical protein ACVPW9_18420, partial [Klebsiella pneumoniae]
SDGNGSHASTLKSPSYTKSVSWQHYPKRREKLIFMAEAIPALQQAGRMKIGQPFDVEIIGDE